jgi:hypothetical protein
VYLPPLQLSEGLGDAYFLPSTPAEVTGGALFPPPNLSQDPGGAFCPPLKLLRRPGGVCFSFRPRTARKNKWTRDEDMALIRLVGQIGTTDWSLVASRMANRTGKQCRERWVVQLAPNLNLGNWTPEEDAVILYQQEKSGNCWSRIASFLHNRSATAVKNRWRFLDHQRTTRSGNGREPGAAGRRTETQMEARDLAENFNDDTSDSGFE